MWHHRRQRRAQRIDPGSTVAQLIDAQFLRHDPLRAEHQAACTARLAPLQERLEAAQEAGNGMQWTEQVYIEAKWLLRYTTDWARLDAQVARMEESFGIQDQGAAVRQSPVDGSWGAGYDEWFLRLDSSIDAINALAATPDRKAAYPLSFLEPVSTPLNIQVMLNRLRVSDIVHTGVDNRDALGGVTTFLSEIFFKSSLRKAVTRQTTGFTITDELVDSYRAYQDEWQDPETGYWGAWYKDRHRVVKAADLSLTFHTVSYRKGDVRLWPQIFDTTLAGKDQGYPYGWKTAGNFINHNNYDVVKIFSLGWPHATAAQQARAADAIGEMLDWCLTQSLQPDGSFKIDPNAYSSVSDAFYYGVVFLDQCGYWGKPFWTAKSFPNAKADAARIAARIQALRLTDESALAALAILRQAAAA